VTHQTTGAALPAQLTVKAVLLSLVLTVILAAANAYLGLFAGLTVATAIPAAVIAMAVLRLFGPPSILENNIVATGASAGSSIAAGAIFTMPALILLGHWERFDYLWTFTIVGLGGLLGVLFSVPLRRTLILEQKLQFPEGVAAAEVLKAGAGTANAASGLKWLGLSAAAGGLFKFATSGLRLAPETFSISQFVGDRGVAFFGYGFSPALLAVGYIVGLNVGILVAAGGAFSWWLAIPLYNTFFATQDPQVMAALADVTDPEGVAFTLWKLRIRYIGVGCMVVGGLWALWSLRNSLAAGIRSGFSRRTQTAGTVPHTEQDLPMPLVMSGIALFVVPLFVLYYLVVGTVGVAIAMAIIMVVAGFLFSSVSGYMAGLVGSSNNPVSGITISTILFASLVLLALLGNDTGRGAVAVVFIGAVVCNAAAVAGDNLQDLKAGQLVGATPWRQQVMLGIGALASAAVMAPVLNLLQDAYGIGEPARPGVQALSAPQATLVKSVAEGMFGGHLPWDMIALGVVVGAGIIAFDLWLKRRGSRWSAPVLAVAVGIYLPLDVSMPILAGGLISELATRWHAARASKGTAGTADTETLQRNGMLFAAGLITGEAIIGILMAIPIAYTSNPDVLAVAEAFRPGQWAGLAVLSAIGYSLYRVATRHAPSG
jgi:putative OPT family oligopeptide transporter